MYTLSLVTYMCVIAYIVFLARCELAKSYGEFKVQLGKFDICKGPKREDSAEITSTLESDTSVKIDMFLKKTIIPSQGKIIALVNGKTNIRLQMKNPCHHLFLKPLFQKLINASQNCEFKKGQHIIHVDMQDIIQKYYGGMFFYGNVTFKASLYNEISNVFCVYLEVNLAPKD